MKKIYEKPVVELVAFAAEEIMSEEALSAVSWEIDLDDYEQ